VTRRTHHVALIAVVVTAITMLVATSRGSSWRLLYNPTQSAPRGWYWLTPARDIAVGQFALARLPVDAARLADRRGYLPLGIPILKRVGAVPGQVVCQACGRVSINAILVAQALGSDSRGRPLISWQGCRALARGEYFLLSASSSASFDSRYFGPIDARSLLGRAVPLWTW
jgi:conjugative transfer signal peptidase TraF